MTAKYAEGTSVPAERSRAELERLLMKYGADGFTTGFAENKAHVMFRMKNRMIRIEIPLPVLEDPQTPSWKRKKGLFYSRDRADQETRRRWRALVLYVKAKLESVNSEIVSFEEAFLSHIVLPDRQTAGQFLIPQITAAYDRNEMPKLLGQ